MVLDHITKLLSLVTKYNLNILFPYFCLFPFFILWNDFYHKKMIYGMDLDNDG